MKRLKAFLDDQQGLDVVEYLLLVTFVCFASAALFEVEATNLHGVWDAAKHMAVFANAISSES